MPIVTLLNASLHRHTPDAETLETIRQKYENGIFFEVASIPLISSESLMKNGEEF